MSESLQKARLETDERNSVISGIIFALICTMLVFSTVAFGSVDVWALGVNSFFAGLLVIFWTIESWREKEFRFNSSTLQLPILGLILIGLLQLLPFRGQNFPLELLSIPAVSSLSLAPYATRLALVQLSIYLIFFAAAQTFIDSEKRIRVIVILTISFASIMAFFGILQQIANIEAIYGLRVSSQAMPFASFINRHHFAAFMEMTIGLTLGLLLGKKTVKKDKRVFLLIAIVIMGIAVIFTGSRGGILSLLVVIIFAVTFNFRQKESSEKDIEDEGGKLRQNSIYIGGGLFLVLILLGSVLLLGGDELLLRSLGIGVSGDVSTGRFHFWQVAWQIFLDYPILGAGLDAFGTMYPNYDSWNGVFRVEQTHNDYLQTLADAGILGFTCIAAYIYLLFKKSSAVRSKDSERFGRAAATGALAGCCGILVHSFFDFPLRTSSNMLFFLILSLIATNLIFPQKKSHKRLNR